MPTPSSPDSSTPRTTPEGARPDTPSAYRHIPGWGADLDHANRPAYPRERTPARLEGVHWDHPEQQPQTVEVLHSIERPGITPVFGTTLPPSGTSGRMRRFAFRYSESDLRHWLLLLAADRVNVVEGLIEDLKRGHVPNLFAEMGGPAELRHNPVGVARKAAIVGAVIGVGYLMLRNRKQRPRQDARRRLR